MNEDDTDIIKKSILKLRKICNKLRKPKKKVKKINRQKALFGPKTPKNRDIQKKILFTPGALFIFKLGTAITVPGVNLDTKSLGFLDIVNAMSGGAFEKASIFALGVMPYMTASIVIQLLAMVIPALERLTKEGGEEGRQKRIE